jgi:hypothetical protein
MKFSSQNLKVRDRLEDLDVNKIIILEWILDIGWEVVGWIHLAQIGTSGRLF